MQKTLENEFALVMKGAQLRIQELSRIQLGYATGKLTAEQAAKEHNQYLDRWGEALPGVVSVDGIKDRQIADELEETRKFMAKYQTKSGDGRPR
jgi:hypothetical protein